MHLLRTYMFLHLQLHCWPLPYTLTTLKPTHTTKPVPNLPVSHLKSSKCHAGYTGEPGTQNEETRNFFKHTLIQ